MFGAHCKAGLKKCGIFQLNRNAYPEASFEPNALQEQERVRF